MTKSKNKVLRYSNLIKRTNNWSSYLWKKLAGLEKGFEFNLVNFGKIHVPRKMLGAFRENFFDEIYFRYLPKHLFEGKSDLTIVDIGANVGYFSLAAFSKVPNAKIVAFEPHPYCYDVLKGYQNDFPEFEWEINNLAVSSEKGVLTLYTDAADGFTTIASTHQKEGGVKIDVPTVKLDEFLAEKGIAQIDLIKLDCEGAEYGILYSLDTSFFESVNALCIETHIVAEENHNIIALNEYLQQIGYNTYHLDEGDTGYIWAWK